MGTLGIHVDIAECLKDPGEENNILLRPRNEIIIFFIIHSLFMMIRLIAIIYFIRQARMHRKNSSEGSRDNYTYLTFVFLGISSISLFLSRLIYMIGSFLIITSDGSEKSLTNIRSFYCDYHFEINLIQAILRPGLAYFSQNLAFLINIQRWLILLSGCFLGQQSKVNQQYQKNLLQQDQNNSNQRQILELTNSSPERPNSSFLQKKFKVLIFGIVMASIVYTVVLIFSIFGKYFSITYFAYQGTMNLVLIYGYHVIYQRFCRYHETILTTQAKILRQNEKENIKKTNNEIFRFFMYIWLMLSTQFAYLLTVGVDDFLDKNRVMDIITDGMTSLIMITYSLMYLGISNSVKRAFRAQVKQRKNSDILYKERMNKEGRRTHSSSINHESFQMNDSQRLITSLMDHTSLFIDSQGNQDYQEELETKAMLFRKTQFRYGADQVLFTSKTGATSHDDELKSTENSNAPQHTNQSYL